MPEICEEKICKSNGNQRKRMVLERVSCIPSFFHLFSMFLPFGSVKWKKWRIDGTKVIPQDFDPKHFFAFHTVKSKKMENKWTPTHAKNKWTSQKEMQEQMQENGPHGQLRKKKCRNMDLQNWTGNRPRQLEYQTVLMIIYLSGLLCRQKFLCSHLLSYSSISKQRLAQDQCFTMLVRWMATNNRRTIPFLLVAMPFSS